MSRPAALDDASLVEPAALVEHFLAHPPEGFAAHVLPSGVPAFVAPSICSLPRTRSTAPLRAAPARPALVAALAAAAHLFGAAPR